MARTIKTLCVIIVFLCIGSVETYCSDTILHAIENWRENDVIERRKLESRGYRCTITNRIRISCGRSDHDNEPCIPEYEYYKEIAGIRYKIRTNSLPISCYRLRRGVMDLHYLRDVFRGTDDTVITNHIETLSKYERAINNLETVAIFDGVCDTVTDLVIPDSVNYRGQLIPVRHGLFLQRYDDGYVQYNYENSVLDFSADTNINKDINNNNVYDRYYSSNNLRTIRIAKEVNFLEQNGELSDSYNIIENNKLECVCVHKDNKVYKTYGDGVLYSIQLPHDPRQKFYLEYYKEYEFKFKRFKSPCPNYGINYDMLLYYPPEKKDTSYHIKEGTTFVRGDFNKYVKHLIFPTTTTKIASNFDGCKRLKTIEFSGANPKYIPTEYGYSVLEITEIPQNIIIVVPKGSINLYREYFPNHKIVESDKTKEEQYQIVRQIVDDKINLIDTSEQFQPFWIRHEYHKIDGILKPILSQQPMYDAYKWYADSVMYPDKKDKWNATVEEYFLSLGLKAVPKKTERFCKRKGIIYPNLLHEDLEEYHMLLIEDKIIKYRTEMYNATKQYSDSIEK